MSPARLSKSPRLLTIICIIVWMLIGSYWAAVWIAPNQFLFEILRLVTAVVSLIPMIAYGWVVARDFRYYARFDLVTLLTFGVTLYAFSATGHNLWTFIWRVAGKPSWMFDAPIQGFFIFTSLFASICVTLAPGAIGGRIPTRNFMWIAGAIALGVGCALVTLWMKVDLTAWVESIRPYVMGYD